MKVLIFSPQFEKGALEILQRNLANDLKKKGIDICTLNMYSKSLNKYSKNKLLGFEDKYNQYFLNLPYNPNPLNLLFGIIKLRCLLKKEKIDIVETSSEALSILTSIASLGTKTFHVIGIHKTYNRKNSYKNSFREIILKIISKLKKNTFFYAVSESSRKSWIDFSKTQNNKVKVIFNSIDLKDNISRNKSIKRELLNEFNIPKDSKIIISVGRICSHKRQDFLIKSLGPILRKNNFFLILVGDIDSVKNDNDQTLNKINFLIKKFDVKSFVKFTGYRVDIKDLMSISDIFVHSTLTEAFGLVLIEAMSMGLPIVSTKVEAIPEFVPEPDNYLVNINDHKSFSNAVEKILSRNGKFKKDVFIRNSNYGKSNIFTRSNRAEKMYKFFNEILKT